MQPLTIAIGNYGITKALKDGVVRSDRLKLNFVAVEPITTAMRRMVRNLEFDVCEVAFTTYLCAKALGVPITAIPVFLTRNFHHWAIFHNVKAGLRSPKELEGRTVAVNRGYTVTTGLWARGVLGTEYGVDLDKIIWAPTDEEHVAIYRAPPNVDYRWRGVFVADLLLSGRCDAAVGDVRSEACEIQGLIPDARDAALAWYRKTGIYPINHGVVVRNDVLDAAPWIAEELVALFGAAKAHYRARLDAGADPSPAGKAATELGRSIGDPFPFGVAANRKALEAITRFAFEQHVTPRELSVEELFAPNTAAA